MDKVLSRRLLSTGRFVTVKFIKKDGSIRTINGRTGVKKHLNGGYNYNDTNKYLTIYDVVEKGYRNINYDTIMSINCDRIHLEVKR